MKKVIETAKNTIAGLYHTDEPLIEAVRDYLFENPSEMVGKSIYDTHIVLEVGINVEPEQDVFDCYKLELTISDEEGDNERSINVDELYLEVLAHLTSMRIAYYEHLSEHEDIYRPL